MATHRTTVNVSITPELDAFLQARVKPIPLGETHFRSRILASAMGSKTAKHVMKSRVQTQFRL
jgi:hypothetical protein